MPPVKQPLHAMHPINTRTNWHRWLRPIARVVIAAQVALALQPLSALAQQSNAEAAPAAQQQLRRLAQWQQRIEQGKLAQASAALSVGERASERTSRNLAQVHTLVQSLHNRTQRNLQARQTSQASESAQRLTLQAQQQATQDQTHIGTLLGSIQADTQAVLDDFARQRTDLQARGASAEILRRHDQAQAELEQRASELAGLTRQWAHRPDSNTLAELGSYFQRHPATKTHTPLDPQKLPWSNPKPTQRAPAETRTAWYQNLYKDQKIHLASAASVGGIQFNIPPEPGQAPLEADLAETPEIQLTPGIRAKAAELGHNPVAIHNWVRNHIEWIPTWGAMQSAQDTLDKQRGNALDTASLEIALLRASSIPARYQLGTIDVPASQAMNWVGGVQTPSAALSLLNQGGIAARGTAQAGGISSIRMEHAWVQAYVNWAPSRGNRNATGSQHVNPNGPLNAWVPLDASAKQYSYSAGMDLKRTVPVDRSALTQAAQQGATTTENFAQNLNLQALQAEISRHQSQVKTYIDSSPTGPNSTLNDVLGGKSIQQQAPTLLAGILPHTTVMQGSQVAELPDSLRWKVALHLYQTDNDRANDSPSVTVVSPLAELGNKRLAISYEPATPADQALIDTAAQAGQTSFSAYLTRYVPRIKLDFAVLGKGYEQRPGERGQLNVTMKGPDGEISRDYTLTSGDTAVLSVNPTGTPAQTYQNRARDYAMNTLDTARYGLQGLAEEMLHQLGLAWWAQKYAAQDTMAATMDVVHYMLPSHALILAPVSVRYFYGIPRSASYKTRAMDAKLDYVMVQHKTGDASAQREFTRAAGKYGSYMEGAIFDQAFNPFTPNAVSTMSLIGKAHAKGLKVYHLKAGDEALVRQLGINADVQDEILNALAYGHQVTVPERDVTLGSYTGLGYIIEDPVDGSGAYQIDGGRSGGSSDALESVAPVAQMPDNNLIGLLLGGALRQAQAKLAIDNGMIIGVVLPSVAIGIEALAALLGVLILLMMLAKSLDTAKETSYPRQSPKRFRHYTNVQSIIAASGYLLVSEAGFTLGGGGIYVANAEDEERRGLVCGSLDSLDIVTRFQIPPPPSQPDPSRVTGYVEITELLKGWLFYVSMINPVGQIEYLIKTPVVWVKNPRPNGDLLVRALLMTPGAVEITDICN